MPLFIELEAFEKMLSTSRLFCQIIKLLWTSKGKYEGLN